MAKTTSFVLGEHFEQLIAQQMHTGRYSSASEVVREALRIFENQQAAIKRLNDAIEEGYASGFVDELDWDALDKRADKAAASA
ncbi:type II toxin-antitoxin system ParD family antitoxin [Planktomarina temperata]|jgi:antitoxin ParD1/3/4|nr:type II toxin-antitoxin system ParD family antitoxin [Planktomarina temperata]MDA7482466.1 type II toxin-antitoxin system ParD family antitoxin [Planktomarina temperata]